MTDHELVVRDIVAAAGGSLVGKTRLQKTAYLLKISGHYPDLDFVYHYYGPYSEDVASAAQDAVIDGVIQETEETAQWGGRYSIFSTNYRADFDPAFSKLISEACSADSVTLELAATSAYLALNGYPDSWAETQRRKSQKASPERMEKAKALWRRISTIKTPEALPSI